MRGDFFGANGRNDAGWVRRSKFAFALARSTGLLRPSAIALGLNDALPRTDPGAGSTINLHSWNMIDQEDFDSGSLGAETDVETIYRRGACHRETDPVAACRAAYDEALAQRRFERAMQHVVVGCRTHGDPAACRRVGELPLLVGNQGIPVPAVLAAQLRHMAEFVCLSGARITSLAETDITGRECSHLARQFTLARDQEYMEPAARQFFEAIDEPARAARLHKTACGSLGYPPGCERLRELTRRVGGRELKWGTGILERVTGVVLAAQGRGLISRRGGNSCRARSARCMRAGDS